MRDSKRQRDRVLLVDDSDELRQATRELLEEMGHAVSAAPGAEEALAAFGPGGGERRFDVLVTDVFMPGRSGVELADALLARDRALPVVLTTSRGGETEVRRRLAAGDVAFLAKPFSPGELAAAIAEAKRRAAGRPAGGRPSAGRTLERRPLAAGRAAGRRFRGRRRRGGRACPRDPSR